MKRKTTKATSKKRRTINWRKKFITALREWPSITLAARKARINRQYAYRVYHEDAEFAKQWNTAEREGIYAVEDEAWRRTRKSDTMLIFMLKSHRPETYSERYRVQFDLTEQLKNLMNQLGLTPTDIRSDPALAALFGVAGVVVGDEHGGDHS